MIDKRDRSLILDSLGAMIERARKIRCGAFISGAGNVVPGLAHEAAIENMVETLRQAGPGLREGGDHTAARAVQHARSTIRSTSWTVAEECLAVLKAVNSPRVRMLYDIYHMQIMGGDVIAFIRKNMSWIGHFHVAGVPDRHEPRDRAN